MSTLDLGFDPAEVALDTLRDMVADNVHLSRESMAAIAGAAGVTERTVWNWAAKLRAKLAPAKPVDDTRNVLERLAADGAEGFVFDRLAVAMVYAVGGNLYRFHQELSRHFDMPSYETITRRWKDLPPLVRDGARRGVKNRFNRCLHLLHSATAPNQVWQLDDFHLDIDVIAPRSTKKTCRPHLLVLIDDFDRYPVAFAILPRDPTALDVLCLLAEAIDPRFADDGSGVMVGGVPDLILWDNASVNTADVIADALKFLPGVGRAVAPYTPVAKGKVERAGQTLQAAIVTGQAGVRTTSESPARKDLLAARNADLMTFDALVARAWRVIYEYAHERAHASLRGTTPVEKRATRPYHPRTIPAPDLAGMWMPEPDRRAPRVVQHVGVHACGQYWIAPELGALIGAEVEVRVLHHRRERVAVFYQDNFVCFAVPNLNLDQSLRQPITTDRRNQRQAVYRAARSAKAVQAEATKRSNDGLEDDLVAATLAARSRTAGAGLAESPATATNPSPASPAPVSDPGPTDIDTDPMTAQAPSAAAEQALSRPVRITKPPISRKPRSPKSELSVSSEQKDRRRLSAQRAAASLKKRPKEQDQ